MFNFFKLKTFRWYDIPNYVLNKLAVGDHAYCKQDIAYGSDPRQVLDLYMPHQPREDKAVILFSHGGSWQNGQKDNYVFLAQSLAKDGFYTICMNYRLAPLHKFPDYVEDTIQAIHWLNSPMNAKNHGFNAEKIILLGHSAGAFNVLSAVYHPQLSVEIQNLSSIHAVIGLAGPYSFEHRGDPVAQDAFSQTQPPEKIMPNYFVYSNHIRHLLLLADRDQLVADENTIKMQQALLAVGNRVQVEKIRFSTHVSIIATMAQGLDQVFKTKHLIKNLIDQVD